MRPLRIGVIGLGDIATKAYLPVLASRPGVDMALMTRDPERLRGIARQYGVTRATTDLDELLGLDLDAAFVHAATDAHADLVERLLHAGVHVLVDKPLAANLVDCRRLVELAEARDRSLTVGFNRRYAPSYAALADLPRTVVLMQKNRVGLPDTPRRLVFDDFIHVVDTLRFLLPPDADAELVDVVCSGEGGRLRTVMMTLRAGGVTAVGVMHRVSGSDEEVLEVLGDGHKQRVVNLAEVERHDPSGMRVTRRGDWTPVPTQRGFTAMCAAFLDAVGRGQIISARDALRTHELCEAVVRRAEAAVGSS